MAISAYGLACGQAATYLPSPPSGSEPPGPQSYSPRRLRRLSSREYDNVVRDLLGDASRPARHFITDSYRNGYDNGSAGLAVQSDQVVGYQAAAEALAEAAVQKDTSRLLGGCDATLQGESACEEAFLSSFGARAYRRPLTTTELERLRGAFAAGAAGGFQAGIQTALELILQSPQFLYREELGPADAVGLPGDEVHLSDYEIASQLSFLLTGTLPDDELWNAVQRGEFATADDYRREAVRLLSTPGARETLRAFLHQWLGTGRVAELTKDPAFYPSFNAALATAMASELDLFLDAILWGERGSLRELFTSDQSFADESLGNLYGVPVTGPGFQGVTLDPELRKGVMSRAGFLAVHAAADSSGPVSRGVFVLQAILCTAPPPPPANIPPPVPAGDPLGKSMTTRERFDRHVSSAVCATCHTFIDGLGFGFEEFDGIGAYRSTENGKPIDRSGTIFGTGEIDGDYNGAGELSTRLAGSRQVVDCYARQAYRFAMGEIEPGADTASSDWLRTGFSSDRRLTDVLMNIVTSPVFVTRKFEP